RDERHVALGPVSCARCGAAVLVAKFSPQHTSVQWSAAAVRACAEFGALVAEGRPSALVEGCASLRDSIDAVVAGGLAATLSVTLDGATTLLPWQAGTRMLDVLIEAGLDAPYSCRQGICGACACLLT